MKVIDLINNMHHNRYYFKLLDENYKLIIKADLRLANYIDGLKDKKVLKYTYDEDSVIAWIEFDGRW